MNHLSLENIAERAVEKAGGKKKLCNAIDISRDTLDAILNGTLKRQPWPRTVGKLTAYILENNNQGDRHEV